MPILARFVTVIALLAAARVGAAQTVVHAPDNNLRFTVPIGWKAVPSGSGFTVTGPDSAAWQLVVTSYTGTATDAPANSPALHQQAAAAGAALLTGSEYAGVRTTPVDGGAGAIYMYRGRGADGKPTQASLYFAVIGSHLVTVIPVKQPQAAHTYELYLIVKSLAFADAPRKVPGARQTVGAQQPVGVAGQSTISTSVVSKPVRAAPLVQAKRAAPPAGPMVAEGYTGKLYSTDMQFALTLRNDLSATADWHRTGNDLAHYTGTYSGTDGIYSIRLNSAAGAATSLELSTHELGGMVEGWFRTDTSHAQHVISHLELTSLEGGSFHKKAAGGAAGSGTAPARQLPTSYSRNRGVPRNNIRINMRAYQALMKYQAQRRGR